MTEIEAVATANWSLAGVYIERDGKLEVMVKKKQEKEHTNNALCNTVIGS